MTSYDGGCLCGRVRFRVTASPLDSGYCHCRMCQRNSGAPAVAWVTFPAASFAWVAGPPGTYPSSARAKRSFCPTCGSYMVFVSADSPAEVSVNTACLDTPEAFPPRKHIFAETRIPWFQTADDLPRHQGHAGSGPVSSSG